MDIQAAVGNTNELAFLDQLMAQEAGPAVADAPPSTTKAEPEAKTAPAAGEGDAVVKSEDDEPPLASVDVQKPVCPAISNTDELAFLDALAGVHPDSGAPGLGDEEKKEPPPPKQEVKCESSEAHENASAPPQEPESKAEVEEEETFERDASELLGAFKSAAPETAEEARCADDLMKDFLSDMKSVDRDNEVNRVLWAFKLNPFEKLGLRFTATESDVRKAYRKISLLIHPDKCSHPQAADAFEILGQAQKELLDEQRREELMRVLEYAREEVHKERRKATKHDSAMRIAANLHEKGRQGVEEQWEQTDDFHERWKMAAREVIAKAAFRRKRLNKRLKEEEERITKEEKEEAQQRKRARQDKKEWLDHRGSRISSWRDWNKSGKKVKGVKAPKIKTSDAERSYVQRATTEQFVGNYRKKPPK